MALTAAQNQQVNSIRTQALAIQSKLNSMGSTGGGGAVVGGRIVGAGGVDMGAANPADLPGAGSPRVSVPTEPISPEQPTDVSQPSPETAQIKPPTMSGASVPMEQAIKNLQTGGLKGQQLTDATASLKDWYQKGAGVAKGLPPPQDAGAGYAGASQIMGGIQPADEPQSTWTNINGLDPNIDKNFIMFDDLMSPIQQKTSLVEEYQKLSKSLGLEALNTELMDAKRIIEGTEDDIRAEVTATGGFATDSQVLALSNARNKSLIKNYNALLDTRNNTMQQLSTIMDLSIKDREMASAEFDRKMNYAFKVAEFKERATTNARSGLQWAIQNGAGAEILNSPYETSLVERTLGLPSGSLAGIVQKQQEAADLERRKAEADIANTYSAINERNKPPTPADDLYQQERSTRILQSVAELKGRVGKSTVGFFGSGLAKVAGTPARDFRADLETIKGNIFTGELTAMRAASKTGGAVGNVSDKEGDKLQAALGALDQSQSVASFNRNLQQIEDSIVRWYETIHGEGLSVAPDGSGNLIRITD